MALCSPDEGRGTYPALKSQQKLLYNTNVLRKIGLYAIFSMGKLCPASANYGKVKAGMKIHKRS